ncbi:MAG TPA: RluA family pseudouridine synthase [Candidatus Omnitrophota bacterium]|nr:RluA family pseudouridine synthase [Candidatus Omnitrophota bacterium]
MPKRAEEELFVERKYGILYEDDFFLVVDKPAPLPVHPVGRFKEKNLLSFLKRDLGPRAEALRIVNRLDSETSGLVIVARDGDEAGKLGLLFEKRQVYKEYRAIVFGIPSPQKGNISISLGTDGRNSHNIRIPDPQGQTASTDYEVLEIWKEYSLMKIIPHTGRTHQIRAHLAFWGHPVLGDKIYIDPRVFERYIEEGWQEDMLNVVKAKRLCLHALKLEFEHPETGAAMKFTSPMPVFLLEECRRLRG